MPSQFTPTPPVKKVQAGDRFGVWRVIRRSSASLGFLCWRCECGSGHQTVLRQAQLLQEPPCRVYSPRPPTKPPSRRTHGMTGTREHRIWKLMLVRCRNPHSKSFPTYGGRGIRVCDRWLDFAAFFADMGSAPSPSHTLDRFPDQDGSYEPGNVRWATRKEQSRNTSTNRMLTHGGETLCVAEWAERTGLSADLVRSRLRRGWNPADVLTPPAPDDWRRKGVRNGTHPQVSPVSGSSTS